MNPFFRNFISITLLSVAAFAAFGHPMARMHEADMEGVFARIDGGAFRETVDDISSGIDNELPALFHEKIGPIPGNHRIIGHGWTLDGAIPKDVLEELERVHPGRKADIIRLWKDYAKRVTARMQDATGLPAKQAQALAGIHWDIHLLGDRTADNSLVERVLPVRDIERNLEKNCDVLFKGRDGYSKAIRAAMRETLAKGGTDADQAARLIKCLQDEVPFSEMLSRRWGRTLGTRGIRILPHGAASVTTDSFLGRFGIAVPESFSTKVAKGRSKKGSAPKGGGKAGTGANAARRGARTALGAVRAFGVALPVVIETGFFFYDERKNREAFESGERTAEERQCVTYENIGRHGAGLALGSAGAGVGATYGAGIGTVEPGAGNVVGGVVGGVLGGIAGGIAGEIGGQTAGERIYVSRAKKNAERGDPAAMFFLGGYHYKRIRPGREGHVKEASNWLSRAANATNGAITKANVYLGHMAWDGIGCSTNRAYAVRLWTAASEKGDVDAMYLLARALLSGEGTVQNVEAGHHWMRESAALGCELALDAYPETNALFEDWKRQKAKRGKLCRILGCLCVASLLIVIVIGTFKAASRRTGKSANRQHREANDGDN